jgi:hypothetical protein
MEMAVGNPATIRKLIKPALFQKGLSVEKTENSRLIGAVN